MNLKPIICLALALIATSGCTEDPSNSADIQEVAQQVGDVMASVDESGGSSDGTIAFMEGQRSFMAKKEKQFFKTPVWDLFDLFNPMNSAQAVACGDTIFNGCSSGVKVRDFNGCTVGSAVFTGTVSLTFSQSSCVLNNNGDTVDRTPNFTVTGRRNATLTVTKTSTNGQRLVRGATANNLTLSNDGIRRVFAANGVTLFDFTTETTSNITVTGSSRSGRVMSGGTLRVTNNSTSVACEYVPTAVTWTNTCNCATSGNWAGTCSDGRSSSVDITGCGTATVTVGDSTESLNFDRCYSTN